MRADQETAWRSRGIRSAAILAAVLLLVAGCNDDQRRSITLWHQMRPEDRAILEEQIEQFEASHPEIQVRSLYKETEELRSGMESAVLVGSGPELIYYPSDQIGVFTAIDALQDMTPWFPESLQQQFDPRTVIDAPADRSADTDKLVFVGDRFGNHLALIYNRHMLPEPPRTTDELVAMAKANTVDEDGDGKPDRYGIVWNYTEPFFVIPFLTGFGGWVFDESKPQSSSVDPALNTPAAVAAWQFVADLRLKHRVLPRSADYNAAASLFTAGKSAMLIDGDWSWQKYLKSEDIDAAVAPLPTVSATGRPMAPMVAPKGYSLSVAATDQAAEDAMQLVLHLTSEAAQRQYLQQQRIVPSRLALRDDPIFQSDPTLRASKEQADRGRLMPTAAELRAIWNAMRPPYQLLMAGQLEAEETGERMQQGAIAAIETITSTVEPDASAVWVSAIGVAAVLGGLAWQRRAIIQFVQDLPRNRLAYAMVTPSLVVILVTVLFPLAFNVVLSFSNMSLTSFHDWKIIGWRHYASLFSGEQAVRFWTVFGKTAAWTAINVTFHVGLGVMLAVVINGPVRGKSIYRVLLIIPWAVPAYITALTWRGMFDYEFGAVNQFMIAVNGLLPEVLRLPIVDWLNQPTPAFSACIIANVWLGFPFMMVIALGGLQGIPQELYEAAQIDRASRWQQFTQITLPMLVPVLTPAVTLGAVWTFNNLNVVWLVSNGGEPADQTHILVSYVYKAVFNLYQYGYGAALSMVIFLILLTFSVLFLRNTKAIAN